MGSSAGKHGVANIRLVSRMDVALRGAFLPASVARRLFRSLTWTSSSVSIEVHLWSITVDDDKSKEIKILTLQKRLLSAKFDSDVFELFKKKFSAFPNELLSLKTYFVIKIIATIFLPVGLYNSPLMDRAHNTKR